jgi:exopolyphosphatase/guanosine-5'-triphosphate,3'-diphosphate pyrophosphatase
MILSQSKIDKSAENLNGLYASIDLGSNSFRMMIAKINHLPSGVQFQTIDTLRDTVRLAGGLNKENELSEDSMTKALAAILRFGDRLRSFNPSQVIAVATNTFRVARNAKKFVDEAERLLGFPIDVISGNEEARLIYIGASYIAPMCAGKRLVFDIGGGSTEIIIGDGHEPKLLESLPIGCVSFSQKFFSEGVVSEENFKAAQNAALKEIKGIAPFYRKMGWEQAIGSSGTARAIAELIALNDLSGEPHNLPVEESGGVITRHGLELLKKTLLETKHTEKLNLLGLKSDRKPVLPGGLAIMISAFEELNIEHMEITEAALLFGSLHHLYDQSKNGAHTKKKSILKTLFNSIGKLENPDTRHGLIEQLGKRFNIDEAQFRRVSETADFFLDQLTSFKKEDRKNNRKLLTWASFLHEVGLSVSRTDYQKHSAYIISNADLPGFSRLDQARLAGLVLGHNGKLNKLPISPGYIDWHLLFCLRLAHVVSRKREDTALPLIKVQQSAKGFKLKISKTWLEKNPFIQFGLNKEASDWKKIEWRYDIELY